VKHHRSIAYHSKGREISQYTTVNLCRYEVLLAIAKFIPFKDKEVKKPWVEAAPHAILAFNSVVHSALSQGKTGVTRGEQHPLWKRVFLPLTQKVGSDSRCRSYVKCLIPEQVGQRP